MTLNQKSQLRLLSIKFGLNIGLNKSIFTECEEVHIKTSQAHCVRTRVPKILDTILLHSTNCLNKILFYHEHFVYYVTPAFTVYTKLTNSHATERNCELAERRLKIERVRERERTYTY